MQNLAESRSATIVAEAESNPRGRLPGRVRTQNRVRQGYLIAMVRSEKVSVRQAGVDNQAEEHHRVSNTSTPVGNTTVRRLTRLVEPVSSRETNDEVHRRFDDDPELMSMRRWFATKHRSG